MRDVDERKVLDNIGAHIVTGFMKVFGFDVSVGILGRYDDNYPATRETPIRAIMVEYDGDFENCMFAISSIHENSLRPAIEDAVATLDQVYGANNAGVKISTHVFKTREAAIEDLEALFSLATVKIHTPKGDVLIVAAPEFLTSVSKVRHGAEPVGAEATSASPDEMAATGVLDEFSVTDPEIAALLGIEPTPGHGIAAGTTPGVPAAALSATGEANAASVAASQAPLEQWSRLLSGVEVDVSAELGSTRMRLGELTGLSLNCVLTLDQHVDDPVNVFVNGSLFATARLVVVDGEYGIEIINVHETASRGSLAAQLAA